MHFNYVKSFFFSNMWLSEKLFKIHLNSNKGKGNSFKIFQIQLMSSTDRACLCVIPVFGEAEVVGIQIQGL